MSSTSFDSFVSELLSGINAKQNTLDTHTKHSAERQQLLQSAFLGNLQPAKAQNRICQTASSRLYLLDDLHNVLIIQNMILANFLRLMLDTGPPDQRVLELLHDTLVYPVGKVLQGSSALREHNRITVIG